MKQATQVDNTAGRVLLTGGFGIGTNDIPDSAADLNTLRDGGLYFVSGANKPAGTNFGVLLVGTNSNYHGFQIFFDMEGPSSVRVYYRVMSASVYQSWVSLSPAGSGQTWQNVLASRALATNYTNSTGRSITIRAWSAVGTTIAMQMVVNAESVDQVQYNAAGAGGRLSVGAVVPAGSTYRVECSIALSGWVELR